MSTTLTIKNMVCPRCISAVNQIVNGLKLKVKDIRLGAVELDEDVLDAKTMIELDQMLSESGFERIDGKKSQLLERIKTLVIQTIHYENHFQLTINWSDFLSERLAHDYHYLSTLFSSVMGITLEQYIIKQKIEKVKEYLHYDQLAIKEIAFKLGYSSVAHLSAQFKKVTGMPPSAFKKGNSSVDRQSLDGIQ
ncbi:AraC family transcriptional regulator [Reichenbachiella carrageenanivorans]|uniref:AraC family transcriptional regulator n=1 Tax=Reichenbachiella carrageenanivorans TaxID=2979869 RepID=A0ABY6CWM4_9BACT|nr:AraC family transcriptional regulator [Reichenbachiella carrageenanivorans]UXX78310.1 AraC family transcriptional regulator [Reichenbachiella carrageenanivorans]